MSETETSEPITDRSLLTREYLQSINPQMDYSAMDEIAFENMKSLYMLGIEMEQATQDLSPSMPIGVFEYHYSAMFLNPGLIAPEALAVLQHKWNTEVMGDRMIPVNIVSETGDVLFIIPSRVNTTGLTRSDGALTDTLKHFRTLDEHGQGDPTSLAKHLLDHVHSVEDYQSPWASFRNYYGLYNNAETPQDQDESIFL